MAYGSRGFVIALSIVGIAAGIAAAVSGSVPLGIGALAVVVYVLHVMSLRRTASVAAERAAAVEREALIAEREALARRERELAGRTAQVEEQWKLLREMVQERIRRRTGPMEPAPPETDTKKDPLDGTSPAVGPRSEDAVSKRGYSRW